MWTTLYDSMQQRVATNGHGVVAVPVQRGHTHSTTFVLRAIACASQAPARILYCASRKHALRSRHTAHACRAQCAQSRSPQQPEGVPAAATCAPGHPHVVQQRVHGCRVERECQRKLPREHQREDACGQAASRSATAPEHVLTTASVAPPLLCMASRAVGSCTLSGPTLTLSISALEAGSGAGRAGPRRSRW